MHEKACTEYYPLAPPKEGEPKEAKVKRTQVQGRVPWALAWPEYSPSEYTAESIVNSSQKGADADISGAHPTARQLGDPVIKLNQHDGPINRVSHMGVYEIHNGLPRCYYSL